MRMQDFLWAPDDRTSRGSGGAESSVRPDENIQADLNQPSAEKKTPPDAEPGGRRISGPGPNDLTRGLP